jgi:hypothetical protein
MPLKMLMALNLKRRVNSCEEYDKFAATAVTIHSPRQLLTGQAGATGRSLYTPPLPPPSRFQYKLSLLTSSHFFTAPSYGIKRNKEDYTIFAVVFSPSSS